MPIRSDRSRVSGRRGEDGTNGRAKPRRSEEVRSFCSLSEGGRGKDSPPALRERRIQLGVVKARVRHGMPGILIHSDKDCRCGGWESRSPGLEPCFHSMRVETPSPSWS